MKVHPINQERLFFNPNLYKDLFKRLKRYSKNIYLKDEVVSDIIIKGIKVGEIFNFSVTQPIKGYKKKFFLDNITISECVYQTFRVDIKPVDTPNHKTNIEIISIEFYQIGNKVKINEEIRSNYVFNI